MRLGWLDTRFLEVVWLLVFDEKLELLTTYRFTGRETRTRRVDVEGAERLDGAGVPSLGGVETEILRLPVCGPVVRGAEDLDGADFCAGWLLARDREAGSGRDGGWLWLGLERCGAAGVFVSVL